ncbi:hypothetical protein MTR_5g045210 [Medicago truncatula]|uniref:Protein FAR1-RELATED SEQUENCE n=1 Tax=Medicago truncatula TaxID=3880 RepID=G7JY36_MEDTR|nr:hypothetical protein MTR_5g045210 [Medicago truncatula]
MRKESLKFCLILPLTQFRAVLDVKDIKSIPNQYILKRWTREAKIGCAKDTHGRNAQEDINLDSAQWYKEVYPKLVRITTSTSDCKEAHIFVENVIRELSKQVYDMCGKNLGLVTDNDNPQVNHDNPQVNHDNLQVKVRNSISDVPSLQPLHFVPHIHGYELKENVVPNSLNSVSGSQPLHFVSNIHGYGLKIHVGFAF